MKTLGNILWLFLCGFWLCVAWLIVGAVQCITIIGIPFGLQSFKLAGLSLWPFGKTVTYGGGGGSFLMNMLWIIFGGLVLAIIDCIFGIILCITIIGIPFGIQCFKLAKLSFMPFGATIY
ncbi:MAG: YccF domain-containing protein [Firmicutes bacterium]|nr:YccF domain-containing protein [Bacillota bacterium]